MINVAVIGLGQIAHRFCTTVNALDEINLYAVASRSSNKADIFAKQFQADKHYGNYDEVYIDPKVDLVYIALINSCHYENIIKALSHNKHVLCEKPACLSIKELEEVTKLANEKQLFFMEAMKTVFLPAITAAKQHILNGTIGDIKTISANFGFIGDNQRLFEKTLGGGSMFDVGIYNVAVINFLMDSKPMKIKSSNHYQNGVDVSSHAMIEYDDFTAMIFSSLVMKSNKQLIIYGTKGYITIDNFSSAKRLVLNIGDEQMIEDYPLDINGFEYEIREALYCIKNNLIQSQRMPHSMSIINLATVLKIIEK